MKKLTKLSVQWFYAMLERGECDLLDFKQQLEDKSIFGKSLKNFSASYDELARDVVAFANAKGGFLFIGIVDGTKEINNDFEYNEQKVFELIRQIQNRTEPSITLIPHTLSINQRTLLVLEIPFTPQIHRTSKGEYLIRSNDGNKPIEPYEMETIMSEKGLIVYDQKVWHFSPSVTYKDLDKELPIWIDRHRVEQLRNMIGTTYAQSPYLSKSIPDLLDSLGLIKEENDSLGLTTAGILFVGAESTLKELPYYSIKYIRYFEDGTYQPYEYKGNIIDVISSCFQQLKAEIRQQEFVFGLFREYIEDYSEIVIRELLVNACVHRDISRQQIVEIRKYPTYMEFESPGIFPQGVDKTNFLHKTNPRNPYLMDVLRIIGWAEKAGSGFDKIFTDLLSKGKRLLEVQESDNSLTFRVWAETTSSKLPELVAHYQQQTGHAMGIDELLILRQIVEHDKCSIQELEALPHISLYQIKDALVHLQDSELIEGSGRTSGQVYILHASKRVSTKEKVDYVRAKKQNRARQKEAILRYLDEIDTINNTEARILLKLQEKDRSAVSRLFASLVADGEIVQTEDSRVNNVKYRRLHK